MDTSLPLRERAPAKLNLCLHVLGRRADGYHALASLVAFAGVHDDLLLTPGDGLALAVRGPTAGEAGEGADNLVLKAAAAFLAAVPGSRAGAFELIKRLPVAAGLGGGSADAAAALRLLAQANGLAADDSRLAEIAAGIGADVPVCLRCIACVMEGAGERLGPALALPRLFAVLVNPRLAVPTRAVFAALGLAPGDSHGGGMPPLAGAALASREALLAWLAGTRNDLLPPALEVAPGIAEVLGLLEGTPGLRLARMSGSGATCFGLYGDCAAAAAAARQVAAARPGWWVEPTLLA
jgi:4-diphosphocytidyl-2-C-methyl-D-erythritol kinase